MLESAVAWAEWHETQSWKFIPKTSSTCLIELSKLWTSDWISLGLKCSTPVPSKSNKTMANREESVRHFFNLIKRSQRGVFKIYIGHNVFIKYVNPEGIVCL